MQQMSISQIHECCLNIAKEFDSICRRHNIPYYMLGGTMLGAIRHKGFIPWDDDMDFGVPYEYFDTLNQILTSELKKPFRCCTFQNHPCVFFPFIKIEDTTTILEDTSLPVEIEQKIGINIDIFPLFHCSSEDRKFKKARRLIEIEGSIFTNSRNNTDFKIILKKTMRFLLPFKAKWLAKRSLETIKEAKDAPFLFNVYGRWRTKECIPIDWYGSGQDYLFENYKFLGLSNCHSYLTQLYGNYMELPPLTKRDCHSVNAFRRD